MIIMVICGQNRLKKKYYPAGGHKEMGNLINFLLEVEKVVHIY